MLRLLLIALLIVFLLRASWRLLQGVLEGLTGQRGGVPRPPDRGVPMMRDPVCGTFVLPEGALSVPDGGQRVYFCSEACRDKYRARTA